MLSAARPSGVVVTFVTGGGSIDRDAWEKGGAHALRSKGPGSVERVSPRQWERLERELGRGPRGGRPPAPFGCRGDGVVARGCHRADCQGRQGGEPVACLAGSALIGERLELGGQAAGLIPHGTLTQGCRRGAGRTAAVVGGDGGTNTAP